MNQGVITVMVFSTFPKSSRIGISPSDDLASYQDTREEGVLRLHRDTADRVNNYFVRTVNTTRILRKLTFHFRLNKYRIGSVKYVYSCV